MMKNITLCAALFSACLGFAFGQGDSGAAAEGTKLGFKSGGYVYWENFRIWEADYRGGIYKGDWFNSILGGFVLENTMSERLRTRVALEGRFFRPFPEENDQEASRFTKPDAYVHEAKAVYLFGNPEKPLFDMEVGYFLYDYNKDQHNLGEYLFRSKIYPLNLFTDFELPMDRLLGIRLGNKPFKGFSHDLLLTSEYKYYPKSDFSLSYVAAYDLGGILELGAGVSFHHYIPVRPSLVTPTTGLSGERNTYIKVSQSNWTDSAGPHSVAPTEFFLTDLNSRPDADSLSYIPAGGFNRVIRPQVQHTVTNYSHKGIKLMGRATLDPKALIGKPALFGPEDLKLYGEIAVLGWENYDFLYEKRSERTPIMIGFNFPGFKIIDVIGIEAEYCPYKFPNNWEKSLRSGLPQPGSANFTYGTWKPEDYSQDDWKWSVYLRKQVSRGLFISAQMANDHLRLADKAGYTYESLMKDTDNPFTGQWWGILRVTASY